MTSRPARPGEAAAPGPAVQRRPDPPPSGLQVRAAAPRPPRRAAAGSGQRQPGAPRQQAGGPGKGRRAPRERLRCQRNPGFNTRLNAPRNSLLGCGVSRLWEDAGSERPPQIHAPPSQPAGQTSKTPGFWMFSLFASLPCPLFIFVGFGFDPGLPSEGQVGDNVLTFLVRWLLLLSVAGGWWWWVFPGGGGAQARGPAAECTPPACSRPALGLLGEPSAWQGTKPPSPPPQAREVET